MKRCPACGVELEENSNYCSLCGEPQQNEDKEDGTYIRSGRIYKKEKLLTDYQRLTGFQKRKIFWAISGFILISGMVFTLFINLIGKQEITWAQYPASVCLILFVNITLNTFLRKNPVLMLLLSFLSVFALFVLFGIIKGDAILVVKLGVPLILAFYATFILLVFFIRNSRQKGLNVIAYSLLASGFASLSIEGMISVFALNAVHLRWSLVVLISVLFIALLLLYIHYRLKKVTDLKRFFHI